jgi:hypothetical protein
MLSEPLRPHLVEHWPVALQRPHHDSHPHHVRQTRIRRSQDRDQVREQLRGLLAYTGGERVRRRIGPEQRRYIDPPAGLHGLGHRTRVRRRVLGVDDVHEDPDPEN